MSFEKDEKNVFFAFFGTGRGVPSFLNISLDASRRAASNGGIGVKKEWTGEELYSKKS